MTDKLLTKRIKIINDFPGRVQEIGTIIECNKYGFNLPMSFKGEPFMFVCCLDCMPHLFENVDWWAEREISEMPKYVKLKYMEDWIGVYIHEYKIENGIMYFNQWCHDRGIGWLPLDPYFINYEPITAKEYLDYQSTLVK